MVFSSTVFLFLFLPVLLFLYYFAHPRFKNLILLFASIGFYAWGEPRYVLLMLLSILINYCLGILIEKCEGLGKPLLTVAIAYNIGVLYVFKYLSYSVSVINRFTGVSITVPQITLPIGISFFTFQIMSYVIDVYKKQVCAQKNILNLALYISLFPQLIAGPIVRYVDVEKQITAREVNLGKFYEGALRFCIGFSKKILIADQLAPLVDTAFSGAYSSLAGHWAGILAYTLQIYFDFSGYSDMAIGMGKMFGFDFLENFNYPYISKSIKEFWRRWHISLSSWFRDYLYIPLGGSRNGTGRTYLNLLIVFFLTGAWHGAGFNFIAWGLFHAVFLIVERVGLGKILNKLPAALQHIYTILIVMFGWVFFRADNLGSAVAYIKGMFIPCVNDLANFSVMMNSQYVFCIVAGIVFSIPHLKLKEKIDTSAMGKAFIDVSVIALFVLAICYMIGSGYSPFLYFRF